MLGVGRGIAGGQQQSVGSRSGTSSCSVSLMIIFGVGRERPVSTKLRCLAEMSA
jgi:hypothetical protein